MPSRATQKAVVIKNKNPRKPGSYILISARTGFVDVTINNTRFYYNAKATNQPMTTKNITQQLVNANSSPKKTIVIDRKGW